VWRNHSKQLLPQTIFNQPLHQAEPERTVEAVWKALYGEELSAINTTTYKTRHYSTVAVCMTPGSSTFTNGRVSLLVKGYLENAHLKQKLLYMRANKIVTIDQFTASRIKLLRFRDIKYIHMDKKVLCNICNSHDCHKFKAVDSVKDSVKY
jgi:hypothetical protein